MNRICSKSNFKKKYKIDKIEVNSFTIPDSIFKFQIINILYFTINLFFKLLFKQIKFEVIHCITVTWHTLIVIYLTKILDKKKKLIIDHTLYTDLKIYPTWKSKFLFNIKKNILSKADIIRSPSPNLSKQLKTMGLNNYEIFLPNVNYNLFKIISLKNKLKLKSKLNIKKNKFIILSVGRVCLRKGSDILIKTFKKINKKDNYFLIFLGPCDNQFKKYKNQKGIFISDKKVNNVHEYMKVSDLFVLLSRNEGLGIVFLESLASGLRILLPKIKGVSDFIIGKNKLVGKETSYNTNKIKNDINYFYQTRKKNYQQACRARAYQVINSKKIIENLYNNWK